LPGEYQFSVILHCGDELLDHLEGQFFQDVQNQCQHWRSTSWSSLYDRDRVLSETRVGALVLPKITRASWVRSYLISKVTTRASWSGAVIAYWVVTSRTHYTMRPPLLNPQQGCSLHQCLC